jgi:hypothetical protein
MITSAFLNIIFVVLSFLIGLLPNIQTTGAFSIAITTASGYLSTLYSFIPFIVSTLLAIIVFDLVFESGYMIFKVVYWVIRRFPTQS